MSTRTLTILCGVLAWSASAYADDGEPRCDDGKRAPPAAICAAFEAAPKLPAEDPIAKKVLAVWKRVAPPVAALTGRETGLSVLAPGATWDGKPFPPAAYICPGAPPTVYVPATLTEKVYGPAPKYDDDFMGFVLGHELGHRVNDFSADGCQLGAFERPGRGVNEEQLADFRGAFFAAVGGYSTRTLAKKNTVATFLESEFKLRQQVRDQRQQSLVGALERFDAYEGLYATGLALLFAGELDAALRLLAWSDELIEGDGVPLPELKVVRALALMQKAAPDAPYLEAMDGTGHDLSVLRCRAVFASHTPLAEEPGPQKMRGADERARAKVMLGQAKKLLERAAELGADRLVTDSGRACVSIYMGELSDAKRWQTAAAKRVGARAPDSVKGALASNGALLAFADFLQRDPPPGPGKPEAKGWAARVVAQRVAFLPNAELAKAVDLLASYPAPAKAKLETVELVCKGAKGSASFAAPTFSGIVGQCPASWDLDYTMPPGAAIVRSGTTVGVTSCTSSDTRATRVQLAASLDPRYDAADLRLTDHHVIPASAASIDAWACGCDGVALQGVSDTGESVYLAACPAFGVPLGVVFTGANGKVTRVVAIEGGP